MGTVIFQTPGLVDIRAFTMMGVSAKVTANPIGQFGTGMKYSVAVLVRLGAEPLTPLLQRSLRLKMRRFFAIWGRILVIALVSLLAGFLCASVARAAEPPGQPKPAQGVPAGTNPLDPPSYVFVPPYQVPAQTQTICWRQSQYTICNTR